MRKGCEEEIEMGNRNGDRISSIKKLGGDKK
jgi:hypothetical protein